MSTKLFVMVSDSGDGSYQPKYTFNSQWIRLQEERDACGELNYGDDIGVDGDGFHYDILIVPDECTLESLGVHDCAA